MSSLAQIARALRPTLLVRTRQGRPIVVGDRQIVPVARAVVVAIGRPGGPVAAGYAWNRPVAVIETYRGQTRRIPIPNLTRRAGLAMVMLGLLLTLAARQWRRRPGPIRRGRRSLAG